MKKRFISCFMAIFLVGIGIHYAFSEPTAQAHVESTIGEVLEVLSDDALKGPERTKERRGKVIQVIEKGFDFSEMSKRTLGKYWKNLSNDQQQEFTKLFSELIENSYITKIDGYSDEKVLFLKERIKGKYAQVDTEIVANKVNIPLNYRLKQSSNGWNIYDVVIEGVSLIRNYKSQFGEILSKGAYQDLKVQLEDKLKELRKEGNTTSSVRISIRTS